MDTVSLSLRIAGLREECARLGAELVEQGHGLSSEEAFALAGAAQGMANAADAVVALAGAWGARVETTVRSGSWERVHPVGFVDAMAATRGFRVPFTVAGPSAMAASAAAARTPTTAIVVVVIAAARVAARFVPA